MSVSNRPVALASINSSAWVRCLRVRWVDGGGEEHSKSFQRETLPQTADRTVRLFPSGPLTRLCQRSSIPAR